MYKVNRFHGDVIDYISNAQRYETADVSKVGRKLHELWVSELPCPILHLCGTKNMIENTDRIMREFFRTDRCERS